MAVEDADGDVGSPRQTGVLDGSRRGQQSKVEPAVGDSAPTMTLDSEGKFFGQ